MKSVLINDESIPNFIDFDTDSDSCKIYYCFSIPIKNPLIGFLFFILLNELTFILNSRLQISTCVPQKSQLKNLKLICTCF